MIFSITVGKGIGHIYKRNQRNCPYPYPNTNFFIPQHPDSYTQTQNTSVCDAAVFSHDLDYCVLDKNARNHVNTDVNNNDDSRSFENDWKNNRSSTSFGDTKTTNATPNLSNIPPPGKDNLCFQT